MISDNSRFYLLLLAIACLPILIICSGIASEVMLYLTALSGLAFALHKVTRWAPQLPVVSPFQEKILIAMANALLPSLLCIIFGMSIVALALIVLSLGWFNDDSMVYGYERHLSYLREYLEESIPLTKFLGLLSICLLIVIIWPNTKLIGKLATVKTLSSRTLLVLTTVTSFTVLAPYSLKVYEGYLVGLKHEKFSEDYLSINRAQREVIASAVIIESMANQPPQDLQDLSAFIIYISPHPWGANLARRLASNYTSNNLRTLPAIEDISGLGSLKPSDGRATISRVERWLKLSSRDDTPTLRDLRSIEKQAKTMLGEATETRKAVSLAIEEAISPFIKQLEPSSLNAVVAVVADQLIGELAEHVVLHTTVPDIFSLDSAKLFVRKTIKLLGDKPSRLFSFRDKSESQPQTSEAFAQKVADKLEKEMTKENAKAAREREEYFSSLNNRVNGQMTEAQLEALKRYQRTQQARGPNGRGRLGRFGK